MQSKGLPYERGAGRLLGYAQVMKRLCVSRSTAYRLIEEGKLGPVYRIGERAVRVTDKGVEAYLEECKDKDLEAD